MDIIPVTTVKVTDFRVEIPGVGYELYSGFALAREDGMVFTTDGVKPYLHRKGVMKTLAEDGLLPNAKFIKL